MEATCDQNGNEKKDEANGGRKQFVGTEQAQAYAVKNRKKSVKKKLKMKKKKVHRLHLRQS